ncbi:FkbM family methyltransferase [Pseudanabaena sp. BC1403]|uniref:FkbM family methyltransferase n=1 Tax=Pseudanabaena sp. BC1403 TaxID=2043171 RepID=UPI000CD81AA1|nr:FkbM family methyltransferase [Pseudanabaena sp. BC1403]
MQLKADSSDFLGRFREVVSDPLNLVIQRDPRAGFVECGYVYLHNGLMVPVMGPHAYYGDFSSILVINRGVHEPLEEFVFQEVLKHLPTSPLMLELGAYWGHYSMWLKLAHPDANVHLVEPELQNLNAGKHNFELNGFTGEFIQAFVGHNHFSVDQYLAEKGIEKVTILHSDVQGYEVEMLNDCVKSLESKTIDYLFVSTHSQQLHLEVINQLKNFDYRVEISSDFDYETTSCDGFIFASSPLIEPIFKEFMPMSRLQISESQPDFLVDYLLNLLLAN